jgi:hypothetical protein
MDHRYWLIPPLLLLLLLSACAPTGRNSSPTADKTESSQQGQNSRNLTPAPTKSPTLPEIPVPTAGKFTAARERVAQALGIDPEKVSLASYQRVQWPDACLGVNPEGQMCAQVITPGYRLVYITPQGEIKVHTDQEVSIIKIASSLEPVPADNAAVNWERSGGLAGICHRMIITMDGLYNITDCAQSRALAKGQLSPDQLVTLKEYLNRYQTYQWEAKPPEGSADMFNDEYTLYGQGEQTPSQEQQREINAYLAGLSQDLVRPTSITPQSQESGIRGQVLIGPTCPGPIPVDGECPDKPLQTEIVILDHSGQLAAKIQTDAQGRFSVALEPGTYQLRVQNEMGMRLPAVQTVTLERGHIAQVDIQVDSGIR